MGPVVSLPPVNQQLAPCSKVSCCSGEDAGYATRLACSVSGLSGWGRSTVGSRVNIALLISKGQPCAEPRELLHTKEGTLKEGTLCKGGDSKVAQ